MLPLQGLAQVSGVAAPDVPRLVRAALEVCHARASRLGLACGLARPLALPCRLALFVLLDAAGLAMKQGCGPELSHHTRELETCWQSAKVTREHKAEE